MVTLTTITTAFLYMISLQTKVRGHDINNAKALWLAEAGLQRYMYLLTNDATYRATYPDLSASLGDGSYAVTATYAVVDEVDTYSLVSTGTVGDFSRKVTQDAVVTSGALDRTIHADGAHVDFDDSTGIVSGSVSCFVAVDNEGGMTITGDVTEAYRPKIKPVVNFAYYETLADAAGQKITSNNYTFEDATYTGVWYSTQSFIIGDNARIEGSIIAEGSINFANEADNVYIVPDPATNYPALVSSGSISTSASGPPAGRIGLQNSTIAGLIWADNNITLDYLKNGVAITGTILAGNNIDITNSSDITVTYDVDIYRPFPPGVSFTGGSDVTSIAQVSWHEVVPAN